MTPEQRKLNAERLLLDDTLREALDMVMSEAVAVFRHPASSQEDIMEAHLMVRALGAFETKLQSFILDGELAKRRK